MAKGRINKTNVDRLVCPIGKTMDVIWDDALRGFGVVVLPSGRKTFIAQWKRHGRSQKAKIGLYGPMTAEQARSQATILFGEIEAGRDPIAERKAARAVRTFREIAADFMEHHVAAKRKPKTAFEYGRLLDTYVLPAIGAKRIVDVSRRCGALAFELAADAASGEPRDLGHLRRLGLGLSARRSGVHKKSRGSAGTLSGE
jgi:hypothetical protein